jgi:DNA-binding response OmpR family regulator
VSLAGPRLVEIRTGHLLLDLAARTASMNNHLLHLTGKEYGILEVAEPAQGHGADQGDVF